MIEAPAAGDTRHRTQGLAASHLGQPVQRPGLMS